MIRPRYWNVMLGLMVGTAWVVTYGFVLPGNPEVPHRVLWLLLLPFVPGTLLFVLLSGDAISRAGWIVGISALPTLAVSYVLSRHTDPEGTAWVWVHAVTPFALVMLGAVVAALGVALVLRLRAPR